MQTTENNYDKCKKFIPLHIRIIKCKLFFHVKCSGTTKKKFLELELKNEKWKCFNCVSNLMPFSHVDINELFLEMENKTNLVNSTLNFTI